MGQARETDLPGRVERIIAPLLADMGYDIVRVQLTGGAGAVLQVMAERRDGRGMTLDDCAEISRTVSALFDVEDPIPRSYTLEVSSPGIDRPLVKDADFARFAGRRAQIETSRPIEGRRRFRGRLLGVAEGAVRIATAEGERAVPLAEIHRAKLIGSEDMPAPGAQGKRTGGKAR